MSSIFICKGENTINHEFYCAKFDNIAHKTPFVKCFFKKSIDFLKNIVYNNIVKHFSY